MKAKPTIFISYATEDARIADIIKRAIQERHSKAFNIFIASDTESIQPGDDWGKRIDNAVKDSSLFLALLTENSNSRPWIYWECGGAYYRKIRIIPLLGPELDIADLEVRFPSIQAANLLTPDDLCAMMQCIDELSSQRPKCKFKPEILLARLKKAFSKESTPTGKAWLDEAEPRIQQFIGSIPQGSLDTIRIVSYTGETTAKRLPHLISSSTKPERAIKIKIMLRSEYSGFTSRPLDADFNRLIRRRISRAKARWYRWAKSLENQTRFEVDLSIRDYNWDPAPKAVILGTSGGYFGQYAIDDAHVLSDHPSIGPARDWVASDTDMVYIDGRQRPFLSSQIRWFDRMWERARSRRNEAYRAIRSDRIWGVLKSKSEGTVRSLVEDWGASQKGGGSPDIDNLALPRSLVESSNETVDIIGCAVVERKRTRCAVMCEIRSPGDSWEGIGKTEAYLELIGLVPTIHPAGSGPSRGTWKKKLLDYISGSNVRWEERDPDDFSLFASDFLWVSVDEKGLTVAPPDGEPAFGLWDVARHLLRKQASAAQHWANGIQRDLQEHQELLCRKLQFSKLSKHYWKGSTGMIRPSLVIALKNPHGNWRHKEINDRQRAVAVLAKVLRSGPHHKSPFWTRTSDEVQSLNATVEDYVGLLEHSTLPRVILVTGRPPPGHLASLVRQRL